MRLTAQDITKIRGLHVRQVSTVWFEMRLDIHRFWPLSVGQEIRLPTSGDKVWWVTETTTIEHLDGSRTQKITAWDANPFATEIVEATA